ncbi:hypothetical protein G6L37_06805 [Agrobacterium rubi]|nr:hypothetical protein [Agrobacterium rubi]NTF25074.1 hypothetical protein [Agrobacterium rubi]
MYDMKPFLSRFFMGPFADRTSAVVGVIAKHGERSLVVGIHDGSWWAQPWRTENYHPDKWPVGFELVDRWEAGLIHLKSRPFRLSIDSSRLDTIRNIFGCSRKDAVTADFDFANWLEDDDFKVKLPEAPEDVSMAANIAGDNDEIFFRIIAESRPGVPNNFSGRQDRRS